FRPKGRDSALQTSPRIRFRNHGIPTGIEGGIRQSPQLLWLQKPAVFRIVYPVPCSSKMAGSTVGVEG
ncbi:MAG: hypothetical protein KDK33_17965, partial [Leptospiraceae bacterium]|nr:hypothetical protein [Leptospiraceae bacterium]